MQFHYDKTLKQKVDAPAQVADETPARLLVCLAKSLRDWLGESCRISWHEGETQLYLGYEVLSVPVLEFAQAFATLACRVNSLWPVQIFGMADNGELIELSFAEMNGAYIVQQHSISGIWCEDFQSIYLCIQFPDSLSAGCMCRLLGATIHNESVVAFDWKYADFLRQQKLFAEDRTLSYCYVLLDSDTEPNEPALCLSGLQLKQKQTLWHLFLEKHLIPPEFEWVRDSLLQDSVPNWIEWHLALYHTLEQLGIRFLCHEGQFELVDQAGKRLYFSVDHSSAAEHVLMKILSPLNQ